ncbi:hypothetical protein EGC76_06250 [Pseudidiomarina gelatinasegens]|uniref:Uncharacterized protein n=1 Tax=Pseudidiomarina gelatinasegens TaxID=2487740 RepID=A0A451GDY9_9GAMM|nr:hypothetical protein [Pseudidiomarina gelatinasegens]RWU11140.1 hypothetical protein EGC76_06250 [Pseudidiomarina gelatinasegens]
MLRESNKFIEWHCSAVEESLLEVTVLLLQKFNLLLMFNTFRNHFHIQGVGDTNQHFNQSFLLTLMRYVMQEAAVNFNHINWV